MERARESETSLGSRPKVNLVVGDAAVCILDAAGKETLERTLVAAGVWVRSGG
jgi:hypothetical protein